MIKNPSSKTIRVLLIEDSPEYAEVVRIMLDKVTGARFDVVCARRLSQGLEGLAAGGIDLVLLDLRLPDSQGIDTFNRVYEQTPSVPIIVLTATDNDELATESVQRGAQDYLVKEQVDGRLLAHAIRYAIERKWVEGELRETNTFLQNILESSSAISIMYTDLNGTIRYWNRGAENIFGYTAEEVIGRQKADILYPEDDEETKKKIEEVRLFMMNTGQGTRCEVREITKDGRTRWINLNVTPRFGEGGQMIGILGIGQDITEHKRMEEVLLNAAQEWRTTFDAISDVVCLLDLEKRIIRCNKAMTNLLQKPFNHIIGRNCCELVHGASKPFEGCPFECMRKSRRSEIVMVPMGDLWFSISVDPLLDEGGNLIGAVHIMADITERKRAEEKLQESEERAQAQYKSIPIPTYTWQKDNGSFILIDYNRAADEAAQGKMKGLLGKRVEKVYPDMPEICEDLSRCFTGKTLIRREMRYQVGKTSKYFACTYVYVPPDRVMFHREDITEAKEIDRMKSELISNVSHELRTPLTTIKEGISLVFDGTLGPIREDQKDMLATVKNNIDRLARLINDLLDISKVEAGRMELKKRMVDITLLVEEVLTSFRGQTEKKHITLETRLTRKVSDVFIDPDRISQVLTNLISNSIKFTPGKGHITVSIADRAKKVEISVEDTGLGISPENISRLFDRFSQFNRVYGPGEKGTGLGLAISKEIIEMHGGRIWVESELGRGSTFIFSLPKLSHDEIFREYLTTGLREAVEKNCPLSLVVVRMKNIERIAREHTDEQVAVILGEIEGLIGKALRRRSDIVSRYKYGEIIIAILMDTAKEDALSVRERIRQAIEHEIREKGWPRDIELSLDVVTYPDDATSEEELISKLSKGLWLEETTGKRRKGGKDG